MSDEFHPFVIEQSPINGNFTLWLPEQEGLIEWIEEKYSQSQGDLWNALIHAASKLQGVDISAAYIEPEGNVFVAYAKNEYDLFGIAELISELLEKKSFMLKVAEYAESQDYFYSIWDSISRRWIRCLDNIPDNKESE